MIEINQQTYEALAMEVMRQASDGDNEGVVDQELGDGNSLLLWWHADTVTMHEKDELKVSRHLILGFCGGMRCPCDFDIQKFRQFLKLQD